MKPTILIAAMALGACTTTQQTAGDPAPAAPELPGGACETTALAALVGKSFTPALEADARARAKARTVRAIRPGMAVTMDFRPDRLNIDIDEKNMVAGFRCG
ncbi:I78 family peptidase inhibitor [uncultured Sphingomonas sp.]|uniref:I78 family peptidase inhibitor n=1 Tax=uncultured Sphingomonas sp. TaxID=158754 RepID=UPI0025F44875|nr:I78 family peptidase inhibitor [uncultured Sphingomonas sp.]